MDCQISGAEPFSGIVSTVTHSTPTSERVQRSTEHSIDPAEETVITGDNKDEDFLTVPNNSWRSNSSDSDWVTTTDTSVHSSPSATSMVKDLEIPLEVLEACDGMDDASYLSSSPTSQVSRGKRRVIGRAMTRNNRDDSSDSESSSSEDSESTSSSYDTATSSTSHSTFSSSSTCSCSSCSFCSGSSCSCSDQFSTSFESTDDLTDLPRAKTKARRLGKQAVLKVADKCNQS